MGFGGVWGGSRETFKFKVDRMGVEEVKRGEVDGWEIRGDAG